MFGDRFRLGTSIVVILLVVVLASLIGCSSEEEAVLDECLEQNTEYADQITAIDENWSTAMDNVAESTGTSATFAKAVNELMTLKKEINEIDPPACAGEDHNRYMEGMNSIIVMYQAVVGGPDANPDEAVKSEAEEVMAALQKRFGGG